MKLTKFVVVCIGVAGLLLGMSALVVGWHNASGKILRSGCAALHVSSWEKGTDHMDTGNYESG